LVPWWEDLRERNHLEYLSVDGEAWTGLIWLRAGTGSRLI